MALLTVDDAPSALFAEKAAWLRRRGASALFFLWGEKAAGRRPELVEALRAGFELGNHSWTHPYFSVLSLDAARAEIERTDVLIAGIYASAGVPWRRKRFRFPYFDRGGDADREAFLQGFLSDLGYEGFSGGPAGTRDCRCDFDLRDYLLDRPASDGGLSADEILARIVPGAPAAGDVILLHDHERSHDLFFACVERCSALGVPFGAP